jgi:aspartyl-tRNA(Asn)/glutamyl-tRNA(Gln) amidotransferase subunit C
VPIDSREVRRIAALAQLELDDETVERFRHQLEAILDHVAMLDSLGVDRIPPTSHARAEATPLRADEVRASLTDQEALGNAPDAAAGHFRVPRVIRE